MDPEQYIDELIAKAKAGTISESELAALLAWYNSFDDSVVSVQSSTHPTPEQLKAKIYGRLMERVCDRADKRRTIPGPFIRYAAAVALLIAMAGVVYMASKPNDEAGTEQVHTNDVAPGGNRATLTFSDGRAVALSTAQQGIKMGEAPTYLDGSLVEEIAGVSFTDNNHTMLMLSTPHGGTYQVTLPDGTQVWLNAASTLTYPSSFSDDNRVVELSGEAYFDVAQASRKDGAGTQKPIPFSVRSGGQQVEVLGTEFNIMAYPTDGAIVTTLVSGAVNVHAAGSSTALTAGQQSTVDASGIRTHAVEAEQYVAWKKGKFHFKRTPLEDIMKQIARWYDVEIVYEHGIPQETFSGKVWRDVSLMEVLTILQQSNIDVALKGKKLIINPHNHPSIDSV